MYSLKYYDFKLPRELIAQEAVEPRDHARLMVLRDGIDHRFFYNLPEYLERGDVMILNDTRVVRAKMRGNKESGGRVEILILGRVGDYIYRCLVKGKKIRVGTKLIFGNMEGVVMKKSEGICDIEFSGDIMSLAEKKGEIPLPPYIKGRLDNPERYQTVFSRKRGAVAAPTAGLHFTRELMEKIREVGVKIGFITLHVGYGTFKPVKSEDIRMHRMEEEYYIVPENVADMINNRDGRLFAVGTTVVRALESSSKNGSVHPSQGYTDLFIHPGYEFQSGIDALITNFHVPRSSLIMLTTAFGGYERIMNAYRVAIRERYRFYSLGDAMLIFNM